MANKSSFGIKQKFIIMFALVNFILSFSIALYFKEAQKRMVNKEFESRFQTVAGEIVNSLKRFEKLSSEKLKLSYLYLRNKYKEDPNILVENYRDILDETQISHYFIIKSNGSFEFSTRDQREGTTPENIYDFCEGYRNILKNGQEFETPIILAHPIREPYKFFMGPNHDNSKIIETSLRLDGIFKNFQSSFDMNEELKQISIIMPDGTMLGTAFRAQDSSEINIEYADKTVGVTDGTKYTKIEKGFSSNILKCCECKKKGYAKGNKDFEYKLEILASTKGLESRISNINKRLFLFSGFLFIILTIITTYLISKMLTRIVKLGDFLHQVNLEDHRIPQFEDEHTGYDEISLLAEKINRMLKKIEISREELIAIESDKKVREKAMQVAHDIKSPLTSLEYFYSDFKKHVPEEMRKKGEQSLRRIKDIINTLQDNTGDEDGFHRQMVLPLLERIISEKRQEYKDKDDIYIGLETNSLSYGAFIDVNISELHRSISNIINNSIEASSGRQIEIKIEAQTINNVLTIEIEDNGPGFPEKFIDKLFEKGFTYEKEGGKGLGLSQCKEMVEQNNGTIEAVNKLNSTGAKIILKFYLAQSPEWFSSSINIYPSTKIIVLDDDPTIHNLWDQRIQNVDAHMFSSEEFQVWMRDNQDEITNCLFLLDNELLNSDKTGLDLAREYEIEKQSILVTSHYDDISRKTRFLELGMKMIPKESAKVIPIIYKKTIQLKQYNDFVLIDNDEIVRWTWETKASRFGLKFNAFSSGDEYFKSPIFENIANHVFFVDYKLDDCTGLELAVTLKKAGAEVIYIATGNTRKVDLEENSSINGVIGKSFPLSLIKSLRRGIHHD